MHALKWFVFQSVTCDVQMMNRFMASSRSIPAATIPSTIAEHTPRPADPAPAHTILRSRMEVPALRAALSKPDSVTEPVP